MLRLPTVCVVYWPVRAIDGGIILWIFHRRGKPIKTLHGSWSRL